MLAVPAADRTSDNAAPPLRDLDAVVCLQERDVFEWRAGVQFLDG